MYEDYSEDEKTNFTCNHIHEYDDAEGSPCCCIEHRDETNI